MYAVGTVVDSVDFATTKGQLRVSGTGSESPSVSYPRSFIGQEPMMNAFLR